jgi:hypothetical protein
MGCKFLVMKNIITAVMWIFIFVGIFAALANRGCIL